MADDARVPHTGGSRGASAGGDGRLVLDLSPDATAPGAARHAMQDWLAEQGVAEDVVRDVIVVLSELVTNSVVHAGSRTRVVAELDPEHLRLEIHDGSPRPPVPRTPGGQLAGGYGLRIVEQLTEQWGWTPTSSGKCVWTVHDRHAPASVR